MLTLIDVGGTKVVASHSDGHRLGVLRQWETASFATSKEIVETALEGASGSDVRIAAAGPVVDETVRMTNAKLFFDSRELRNSFGLKRCLLVNDLVAAGWAVKRFDTAKNEKSLILNVGTGLGGAIILPGTDPGVLGFEPGRLSSSLLREIGLRYFSKDADIDLEELEDILSGHGIELLFRTLANEDSNLSSEEVFAAAQSKNLAAANSLECFIDLLAATCAELSLVFAPVKKIWFTGSLLRKNFESIVSDRFYRSLSQRRMIANDGSSIEVDVVPMPNPELEGLLYL